MRPLTVLGLVLTAGWVVSNLLLAAFKLDEMAVMTLNEWGDFLAGASAPLALLWLVIGYFQHGEELRLNTRALEAQQEELRNQVKETATLSENAARQAQATEHLVHLNKVDQERDALREIQDAQPEFVEQGGSSSDAEILTKLLNRGGEAIDIEIEYGGPHRLEFSPERRLRSGAKGILSLYQAAGTAIEHPIPFRLRYTDRFGTRRVRQFELWESHGLREIAEARTASDSMS